MPDLRPWSMVSAALPKVEMNTTRTLPNYQRMLDGF
jgi:hypothetical protein